MRPSGQRHRRVAASLAYGIHAVRALLRVTPQRVRQLWLAEDYIRGARLQGIARHGDRRARPDPACGRRGTRSAGGGRAAPGRRRGNRSCTRAIRKRSSKKRSKRSGTARRCCWCSIPPAGAPNVFSVYLDDAFDAVDALRLFDFHADFAGPGNSTFTERPKAPPGGAFDSRSPGTFNGSRAEIEEPPPAVAADYLNAIGDRLMLRLQYFNRGGTETLTTVQTVNAGIIPPPGVAPTVAEYKAGTRWYVLQKTSAGGNLVGSGPGNLFA